MQALTVRPREKGSAAVREVAEQPESYGPVLVETLAVGICGTDLEIVAGEYGEAPAGQDLLTIGHEAVGRVLDAPSDSGLSAGQRVVGIVRRPDPVPCPNCTVGEWNMCRNGRYTERGIKGLDGYAAERFRIEPQFAVPVDDTLGPLAVLVEPASVVAKAWKHVTAVARRALWQPRRVLVTGAGPVGLLAALLGVQRDLDVHVLDRVEDGPKPDLVRDLDATYHTGSVADVGIEADVIIEATGAASVVFGAMELLPRNGILCLTGLSPAGRRLSLDATALNRELVLENNVVLGSVNANRRHYEQAAAALAAADADWLARILTRHVPIT